MTWARCHLGSDAALEVCFHRAAGEAGPADEAEPVIYDDELGVQGCVRTFAREPLQAEEEYCAGARPMLSACLGVGKQDDRYAARLCNMQRGSNPGLRLCRKVDEQDLRSAYDKTDDGGGESASGPDRLDTLTGVLART
jgi:hypothetical protein